MSVPPTLRLALLAAGTLALAGCSGLPMWMVVQGRASITDHRHFDNAPITHASVPQPLPRQPLALAWPQGRDQAATERWLAEHETAALVVIQRGAVVYEAYFNGHARNSMLTSFSVAKSVVAVLVGLAVADGRIASVDDPITRYLPELRQADARFEQVTLRHLLLMRSGIQFREDYQNPFTGAGRFYLSPDLKADVAGLRIAGPPDQAYHYQSVNTQLLGMAVARAMGQPLSRILQERLWQPIGAEFDASWSLDSPTGGVERAFCCLNARAIDFARFGLLALQQGRWGDRQLVDAAWLQQSMAVQQRPGVDDATQRNIERHNPGAGAFYGWQWRREGLAAVPGGPLVPGDASYAQGYLGQYVYLAPASQTVVVRLGSGRGGRNWPLWMHELAQLNP